MYDTIDEIRIAAEEARSSWFSSAIAEVLDPCIESQVYPLGPTPSHPEGARLWVESHCVDNGVREFKVALFDVKDRLVDWAEHPSFPYPSVEHAQRRIEGIMYRARG